MWFHLDVHPQVFFISAALIIRFVAGTITFHAVLGNVFQAIQDAISLYAGWFFTWTVNIVLVFVLILLASRFGSIRLGGPDAEPEFSTLAWFAMLFSAGMGIGLLFYGVAEPMFHYVANPLSEPGGIEAARKAMEITFPHWIFARGSKVGATVATLGYPFAHHHIYDQVLQHAIISARIAAQNGTKLLLFDSQIHPGGASPHRAGTGGGVCALREPGAADLPQPAALARLPLVRGGNIPAAGGLSRWMKPFAVLART